MNNINKKLKDYFYNTESPELNFDLGYEYEKIEQYAAAIGYYFKCY